MEALKERRRLARDLHDGLTQELSFVRSHLASLAEGKGRPEMLPHIAQAAERALEESRRAAEALSDRPPSRSLPHRAGTRGRGDGLRRANPVEVTAYVEPMLDGAFPPATQAALERIARELSNALRHARPRNVQVRLEVAAERRG